MDKKSFLAFALIATVLILTPWYLKRVSPPPAAPLPSFVDTLRSPPTELPRTPEPVPRTVPQPSTVPERTVTVRTPLYTAQVNTRNGGSLRSFVLNEYLTDDSAQVNLINETNAANLLLGFRSVDGDPVTLDHSWETDAPVRSIVVEDSPYSLQFRTHFQGREILKSLTFYPHSYTVEIDLDLRDAAAQIFQGTCYLAWKGGLPVTEKIRSYYLNYFKGQAYLGGEQFPKRLKIKSSYADTSALGQTDWVATRSKYFLAALIPRQAALGATIGGYKTGEVPIYDLTLQQDIRSSRQVTLYLGPLEYKRIAALGVDLEKMMSLGGPLRPIGQAILWSLTSMHKVIPNYGVVLIIFSILMKILLHPLTKKSYQSTRRMQDLQPRIAVLKEKYKHDPQKMNQAQMKLFKEEGVNPLGGCLPMLLQMPILIALFQVFRATIELRGSPFVFWIKDLSVPDTLIDLPFSVPFFGDQVAGLAILMAITMFFQQRMMPTQATGQQKYMSYFMTGFFYLLFNSFPSGLNLYYTLFNVLTILQQKYITPHTPPSSPAAAKLKPKKRK